MELEKWAEEMAIRCALKPSKQYISCVDDINHSK